MPRAQPRGRLGEPLTTVVEVENGFLLDLLLLISTRVALTIKVERVSLLIYYLKDSGSGL